MKSSPPIITFSRSANSITPGTKVFCGEPLMYAAPSRIDAHAKIVDGDTSGSFASMAAIRLSAVSLTPDWTDAKRSVLAVQSTMTLSRPFFALKSRMSWRMCSRWRFLSSPGTTLSARSLWLAAMKSG